MATDYTYCPFTNRHCVMFCGDRLCEKQPSEIFKPMWDEAFERFGFERAEYDYNVTFSNEDLFSE